MESSLQAALTWAG